MARVWWVMALVPLAAACGPLSYLTHSTLAASHAVEEAKKAHAEDLAPYEYTHAVEYLHKSRELAGFSQWMVSVEYAKKATDMGHLAHQLAETRATSRSGGAAPMAAPVRPVEERRE
jgi:hypothetical protein